MIIKYAIGSFLFLTGVGLLIYRHVVRYHAKSIEFVSVKPYRIFEAIRGWGMYGYICSYNYSGVTYTKKAIELGDRLHKRYKDIIDSGQWIELRDVKTIKSNLVRGNL